MRFHILSKAKQESIDAFIKYFGNNISLFESYQSTLLEKVMSEEKRLKRKLTDVEQSKIYIKLLKNEKTTVLKTLKHELKKNDRTVQHNDNNTLRIIYFLITL